MAEQYKWIDPSDAALAINGISAEQYKWIDPSDIVGAIKNADPNIRDLDRSDAVAAVNEVAGGEGPPPEVTAPDPVPVLSIWNTNPALVLVATADVAKFADGDAVTMAGVLAPYDFVNGVHTIGNVGVAGDGFDLVGVDMTAALTTVGDPGMTATPPAPPASRSSGVARAKKPTR